MSTDSDERHKTAYHESGHAAIAYFSGATVGEMSCVPCRVEGKGEVCGYTHIENQPSVNTRVVTHLAGPLAEAKHYAICHTRELRFDTSFVPDWSRPSMMFDKLKVPYDPQTAQEFPEAFQMLGESQDQDAQFASLLADAKKLINDTTIWNAISVLAEKLAAAGRLPAGEAVAILGQYFQPAQ